MRHLWQGHESCQSLAQPRSQPSYKCALTPMRSPTIMRPNPHHQTPQRSREMTQQQSEPMMRQVQPSDIRPRPITRAVLLHPLGQRDRLGPLGVPTHRGHQRLHPRMQWAAGLAQAPPIRHALRHRLQVRRRRRTHPLRRRDPADR